MTKVSELKKAVEWLETNGFKEVSVMAMEHRGEGDVTLFTDPKSIEAPAIEISRGKTLVRWLHREEKRL